MKKSNLLMLCLMLLLTLLCLAACNECTEHTWGTWSTTKEASCTTKGEQQRTCSTCGNVENAAIEMVAHKPTVDSAKIPTETETGLSEGAHCSVCQTVLTPQRVLPVAEVGTSVQSNLFQISDNTINGSVPADSQYFSFDTYFCIDDAASYIIATDEAFSSIVQDNMPALQVGNNVFYIKVLFFNYERVYTLTIKRLSTFSVKFDAGNGKPVQTVTVEEGDTVTPPADPEMQGHTFIGWDYDFSNEITSNVTIVAKWEHTTHIFTAKETTEEYLASAGNCKTLVTYYYKCAYCHEKSTNTYEGTEFGDHNYDGRTCIFCQDTRPYLRDGDYIYFGEYPQTLKAEEVTITDTLDGRGYYLGSDGAYYAKVTATPYGYRLYNSFACGTTIENGKIYYFKVEPIKWRILKENNGTALLLCDSIIANQPYDNDSDGESNNYAESDIRAWLTEQFYETAFDDLQQELILITTVDNSVESTGYNPNPNVCENTRDKIFLLSYAEVKNSDYNFSPNNTSEDTARCMTPSDYSRATGIWMSSTATADWWLRSPYRSNSYSARYVPYNDSGYSFVSVGLSHIGVVPAMQIRLS